MTKSLCTICARGGSKGVPNKNLRPINGKSLLARTIEQAQTCELFTAIAVSSDSDQILNAAAAAGVEILVNRPPELATDFADKSPAIVHCATVAEKETKTKFDVFVDLDLTAPLRTASDIKSALEVLKSMNASNVFSVCESRRSPYFNMVERDKNGVVTLVRNVENNVVRRQDAPKTYDMNAAIYVWRRDCFFPSAPLFNDRTEIHIMPHERSLDIDDELDWQIATLMLQKLEGEHG